MQSHFVKMAKTLNIGKQFEDFSSLEIAIQQYQKEENVQFFRCQKLTSKVIEKYNFTHRPSVCPFVRQYNFIICFHA